MTMLAGDNVMTGDLILLWNGITKPNTNDDGALSYNVNCLIHRAAPELAELEAIATKCLNESEYRGNLPPNGKWPLGKAADTTKPGLEAFGDYFTVSFKSRMIPTVVDVNGDEMVNMQYNPQLYPGAIIKVLCNAYAYNNKQKGVSFGLQGVQIIDATKPALAVGGSMSAGEVANAFKGGAAAPAAGGYTASVTPPAVGAPPMVPPAVGAPPMPGQVPPPAAPPVPAGPAQNFTQMTEKAEYTYEQYIQSGWTDDLLRQHGLMR